MKISSKLFWQIDEKLSKKVKKKKNSFSIANEIKNDNSQKYLNTPLRILVK